MKEGNCPLCRRYSTLVTHHLILGTANRRLCDEDGLTIDICNECHTIGHTDSGFALHTKIHGNARAADFSKMTGQALYERNVYKALYETITGKRDDTTARDAFIERYGKSYL